MDKYTLEPVNQYNKMKNKSNNLKFFDVHSRSKRWFTLVEMLIAVTLFTIIAFFSIGAILSIFDANRKARSSKTVMDNFNFAVENMVRNVRFGDHYYCGDSPDTSSTNDCSSGGESFSVTFDGVRIIYMKNGDAIQKKVGAGNYENITSPDTIVQNLKFYVFNTASSDDKQPYVIIVIQGYVGNKPSTQTKFSIQTLISQRKLDL